ncbi:MAG: aryl-sulfate sulfotransferase [Cyanobacteria bacterium HKST-UBA03]|nr:aryl-sulfate sulfotransferase [Cyanobacteria bacterium HKST-UBA03]
MKKPVRWTAVACYGVALVLLVYAAGLFTAVLDAWPYRKALDMATYVKLWSQIPESEKQVIGDQFNGVNHQRVGLQVYDQQHAWPGVTLYASAEPNLNAYLVAMDGQVLHRWSFDLTAMFGRQPAKPVYLRRVRLLPNGDLIGLYNSVGFHERPAGIFRASRSGQVLWHNTMFRAHHDFDLLPDGRIVLLAQTFKQQHPTDKRLSSPYVDDEVVLLDAQGRWLETMSIVDAFLATPYERDILLRHNAQGDYLHTNTVHAITAEQAKHFPYGQVGDVLLTHRNRHTVSVLNLASRKVTRLFSEFYSQIHDARLLDNGHILVFENRGVVLPNGRVGSLVKELDVPNRQVVWSYQGSAEKPFFTGPRGGQQRLPNGNTLIFESKSGRIFEVTPAHAIVWEYYTPVRKNGGISTVHRGDRYPIHYWQGRSTS